MSVPVPLSGTILSDLITWVRRLIKTPSNAAVPDSLIADYINRFYVYDMSERVQLFELKRQYTFETIPNIFQYPMPFLQVNGDTIGVPAYQTFRPPIYADGVEMGFYNSTEAFYRIFPEFVNNEQPLMGNDTNGPFQITFGAQPVLRAFIDDLGNLEPYVFITAIDNTGNLAYIVDSGYLNNTGLGVLIQTDSTFQNIIGPPITVVNGVASGGSGTVDYINGIANFTFANGTTIPSTSIIGSQTSPYSSGFPRIALFFNNNFKLYPVPDRPYKIQCDAILTPTQFLNTSNAMPFAYMSEYIARGAARKILSDNGDYDQFPFYEPLFKEQENLVLRRTTRQNQAIGRTPTIFSAQANTQNQWQWTQY